MKRICHVINQHSGGDVRSFEKECISGVNAGYEVYLITTENKFYDRNGVHVVGIGQYQGHLYEQAIFAFKAYQVAKIINADLYQIHFPMFLPYAKKLKCDGKVVIFDAHEDFRSQLRIRPYLTKPAGILFSKLFLWYFRRVSRIFDALVYPGSASGGYYSGFNARLVTVCNFPWLDNYFNRYDKTQEREPNTAGYVGTISENRGITQAVKACSMAKCKLYLAGKFSCKKYEQFLRNMDEWSCVRYLGIIERKAVPGFLQRVSLGLCPTLNLGQDSQDSKAETLSTKAYEYMSMALPVIFGNTPIEIKVNNELDIGYCVDPNNTESFSSTIRAILDAPDMRKKKGENGRRAIKDRLLYWEQEQEKLISLYKELLGE